MKYTRILFALIVIVAVVLIAPGAVGAWNARVQQAPAAVKPAAGLQTNARPQGTVEGNPQAPLSAGECTLLSSYCLTSTEEGLAAEALTELPQGLDLPEGESIELTRVVQVTDPTGAQTELGAEVEFTLDPPLADGEKVAFWDGTAWVEPEVADGKFVIPAGVKLPVVIAVFTE